MRKKTKIILLTLLTAFLTLSMSIRDNSVFIPKNRITKQKIINVKNPEMYSTFFLISFSKKADYVSIIDNKIERKNTRTNEVRTIEIPDDFPIHKTLIYQNKNNKDDIIKVTRKNFTEVHLQRIHHKRGVPVKYFMDLDPDFEDKLLGTYKDSKNNVLSLYAYNSHDISKTKTSILVPEGNNESIIFKESGNKNVSFIIRKN